VESEDLNLKMHDLDRIAISAHTHIFLASLPQDPRPADAALYAGVGNKSSSSHAAPSATATAVSAQVFETSTAASDSGIMVSQRRWGRQGDLMKAQLPEAPAAPPTSSHAPSAAATVSSPAAAAVTGILSLSGANLAATATTTTTAPVAAGLAVGAAPSPAAYHTYDRAPTAEELRKQQLASALFSTGDPSAALAGRASRPRPPVVTSVASPSVPALPVASPGGPPLTPGLDSLLGGGSTNSPLIPAAAVNDMLGSLLAVGGISSPQPLVEYPPPAYSLAGFSNNNTSGPSPLNQEGLPPELERCPHIVGMEELCGDHVLSVHLTKVFAPESITLVLHARNKSGEPLGAVTARLLPLPPGVTAGAGTALFVTAPFVAGRSQLRAVFPLSCAAPASGLTVQGQLTYTDSSHAVRALAFTVPLAAGDLLRPHTLSLSTEQFGGLWGGLPGPAERRQRLTGGTVLCTPEQFAALVDEHLHFCCVQVIGVEAIFAAHTLAGAVLLMHSRVHAAGIDVTVRGESALASEAVLRHLSAVFK
jgi:hypothetical protein